MNEREFNALVQIVSRAPMSQAEALWVGMVIERERLRIAAERALQEVAKNGDHHSQGQ